MPSPRRLVVIEELWARHRAFRVTFVLVFVSVVSAAAFYSAYSLYRRGALHIASLAFIVFLIALRKGVFARIVNAAKTKRRGRR